MTFFFGMQFGPTLAACQTVAKVRMRALSIAVFSLCINLFGQFVGPLIIGYLNDKLVPTYGSGAIRYSLLWTGTVFGIVGVGFLLIAALFYEQDCRRLWKRRLPSGVNTYLTCCVEKSSSIEAAYMAASMYLVCAAKESVQNAFNHCLLITKI